MAWPVSLPDPLLSDYSYSNRQPTISTPMDTGPRRKSRTSTAYESVISLRFSMDQTQYADFQTFYDGEGNAGANWVDIPISTGGVVTDHRCRFMAISVTFKTLNIINVVCTVEVEDRILTMAMVEINSKWMYKNGVDENIYTVIAIANRDSTDPEKYPVTIIYQFESIIRARPLARWHRDMIRVEQ